MADEILARVADLERLCADLRARPASTTLEEGIAEWDWWDQWFAELQSTAHQFGRLQTDVGKRVAAAVVKEARPNDPELPPGHDSVTVMVGREKYCVYVNPRGLHPEIFRFGPLSRVNPPELPGSLLLPAPSLVEPANAD